MEKISRLVFLFNWVGFVTSKIRRILAGACQNVYESPRSDLISFRTEKSGI